MKKLSLAIATVFGLFISVNVMAQTPTGAGYFAGKWEMLVKGLPSGDTKMFIVLDKKDSVLTGMVQDSTGTEISKFSKVELKENQATVYFTAQGFDVNLTMDKKDEDHVTGRMMDMFDAEGLRVKAVK